MTFARMLRVTLELMRPWHFIFYHTAVDRSTSPKNHKRRLQFPDAIRNSVTIGENANGIDIKRSSFIVRGNGNSHNPHNSLYE